MRTAVQRLAAEALGVRYEALPADTITQAKALVLDALGCTLGGVRSAVAGAVRDAAARLGGTPEATLIGAGGRSSAALAALANGTALRFLDANDYHFGRDPAHPSGVLPVGLALAERGRLGGRDLLTALVVAYEIHLRLADLAGAPSLWKRGFHHSTNLALAAAACAARLLGLDAARTAHAMAIAATHAVTLAQLQSGGIANIKASAEAFVAKTAVEAALLAEAGVTGPAAILEGPAGWGRVVAGELDLDALCAPFGAPWKLAETCIKPYAAVATAMAPVQAALDLVRLDGVRPEGIAAVTVGLPGFALGTPSAAPDRRYPATRESADHSFYFCVAVTLLDGACGEAQFDPARLHDPALHRLLAVTELAEDSALTAGWPAAGGVVAVRLTDGRVLERRHAFPPGHPRNPLDAATLRAKFDEHARPVLGESGAARVMDTVMSLERQDNLASLMQLLAGRPG